MFFEEYFPYPLFPLSEFSVSPLDLSVLPSTSFHFHESPCSPPYLDGASISAIIVCPPNFLYLSAFLILDFPIFPSDLPSRISLPCFLQISQGSPCFFPRSPYISHATFCTFSGFLITDLHIFPSCAILDLSQFSCIFSESLCIFIDLSVFPLDFSFRMSLYLF
jgi:hypothetical protein